MEKKMTTKITPFWGKDKPRLRKPCFADNMWYSSKKSQLQHDIQTYLDQATSKPNTEGLIGLVSPHAGHLFSGHVAANAYSGLAPGDFETVILIGVDHHGAGMGQICTLQVDAWHTPLGDIPVDWEMLQAIRQEVKIDLLENDNEHCLEIQLPFLQMTLQQFKLVPLMMSISSLYTCQHLGEVLAKVIPAKTLLIASSDLSHFFNDTTARRLDEATLQFVLNLDEVGFIQHDQTALSSVCGVGAVTTVIYTSKLLGANQTKLLKYATSADVQPHNKERVVGYAAVALTKNNG